MAERPAVNASPPIFLSRGGLLDLLKLSGDEIVVPLQVAGCPNTFSALQTRITRCCAMTMGIRPCI